MASLNQIAQLVSLAGSNVTIFAQGEPGVGKSSILKLLEEQHGAKYQYVYADCPLMDLPDFEIGRASCRERVSFGV